MKSEAIVKGHFRPSKSLLGTEVTSGMEAGSCLGR